MNEFEKQTKSTIDTSTYDDLFVISYLTNSLIYLLIVQSKKEEDIKYDTLLSYNYQYFVGEKIISEKAMKQISRIDSNRKKLSIFIMNLKTIYLSSETIRKILEFDDKFVKKYFDIISYFDNYGLRFNISSIQPSYKNSNMRNVHTIEVDMHISSQDERSEENVYQYMLSLTKDINCEFKILLNYLK